MALTPGVCPVAHGGYGERVLIENRTGVASAIGQAPTRSLVRVSGGDRPPSPVPPIDR